MCIMEQLKSEVKRIMNLAKHHNLFLFPCEIGKFESGNGKGDYNCSVTISLSGKISVIIGERLLNEAPFRYIIAALCHEIGHIVTGNAKLCDKLHLTEWDADEVHPFDLHMLRGAEFQADRYASKLLALGGYNPRTILSCLCWMEWVMTGENAIIDILEDENDDHPCYGRRRRNIIKMINYQF